MRSAIIGFAAGAALLQMQAALPPMPALAAMALLVAGWLALWHGRLARLPAGRALPASVRVSLSLAAGAALGFCWAAYLAQCALAPQLAQADEGRDVTLVGVVDNLPYAVNDGVRFNFAVERVVDDAARIPPHVALSWYADGRGGAVGDPQPGERWQLTVRLQRPHGNANEYGFDYEVWLLEQGLRATGYVRPAAANRRLDGFVFGMHAMVDRCRAVLRERILRTLAGRDYAGVIVALVIGDQRGIGQSDWQVFNRTGIGHLISISGLHITMVAGLAALGASALWRRSFFTGLQLPLRLPAQKVAALAGAGTALAYVLLAGFGVPAQRTLYMLAVLALALWTGRIAAVSHVLCCALVAVVLLDPWAVLWPGFWLSFGAVAIILYAGHGRIGPAARGLRASLAGAGRTQWAVTAGMVPLSILLFAQVSLVSPLANAIAIPLVSFVVTPLALAGSLLPDPLSAWLLLLAHAAVAALAVLLEAMSSWPAAVWHAPAPPWWVFAFALAGTLWLLAPRGWPLRWIGVLAWLPLLAAAPDAPQRGGFRVTAFDVGQGMALLVETAGHRLLYDTGPGYSPGSDAGSRVILPYLRARGIQSLDGMLISHADADHSGGALTLLAELDVGWLASSLALDHPAVQAAHRPLRCTAGQQWEWDGVRFTMLHPSAASYLDTGLKTNARSCVLHIDDGRHAILLAGDIEAAQEAALVAGSKGTLHADVLLAPHHGSGTSSTPAFLQAVAPRIGIFQVGYRNRYHHPKQEVYARYGELGIERLRTDELGALTLDFGAGIHTAGYRLAHARYWYGR